MFHGRIRWFLCTIAFLAMVIPSKTFARNFAVRHDAKLVATISAQALGGLLVNTANPDDQLRILRDFIHPVRFFDDKSGYLFVIDSEGICLAHGETPQLEQTDLSRNLDSNGINIFEKMLSACAQGGGYVEYLWTKPGSQDLYPKLSYVVPILGTDLIVGAGIYFPDPW